MTQDEIQEALQLIVDQHFPGDTVGNDIVGDRPYIEYKDGTEDEHAEPDPITPGWYLCPPECRWFGDYGDYLGNTYQEALKSLNYLLPSI